MERPRIAGVFLHMDAFSASFCFSYPDSSDNEERENKSVLF
jgi:hypothetical protein